MSNFMTATYKETGDKCWLNMDYTVDVFPYSRDEVIAFTFDNERGGYLLAKKAFEELLESEVES